MGGESWFLVGSLVILLSTAAVTHHNGECWVKGYYSSNRRTLTHYYCKNQDFGVLSTENLDPNRTHIDLINLTLARNRIRYVKRDVFHHLEKLKVLVLRGNLIRLLDEDVFSNLKLLQFLDLSFNRLSKLPDRLFSSQDRLETLLLQGNELRTISLPLLTPLSSITSLNFSSNLLRCDCELRVVMLWCKERKIDTKATCKNQVSGYVSQWTQLEFVNNCSENPLLSVLSESVPPCTKSDDRVVAVSSYVVPVFIVVAVALELMCFGLFLLYLTRRGPPSDGTIAEESSVQSDSSSSHSYQYDYVQSPNSYTIPQLPARPIQTIGDLGYVQVDTYHKGHNGIHLKEPILFGTNTACDCCEEGRHMTEPESEKSHRNNQQPVRSEGTSPVSYDLPEHDNPSKMAMSNCSTINRSSDASVMVENCLYRVWRAYAWIRTLYRGARSVWDCCCTVTV